MSSDDAYTRCAHVWQPDEPAVAHVVCDRRLDVNGKHTGKHMFHDPETGKLRVAWWGKSSDFLMFLETK